MIIEDEADIRELLSYNMTREGYSVVECASVEEAQAELKKKLSDLILLDLMLSGTDGFAFCRELRGVERTAKVPVIMVTARDEDADIVAGLEVGADDYVTKPFSSRILAARIKAVLRRRAVEPEDAQDLLKRGPFEIDRTRHAITADGKPLVLTLSEFKALELFVRRPGIVFSRYQIVDAVHGEDYSVTDRSVDVLIVGLRKKLGKYSELIETVRGVGYRMQM
jgi:two-component system phosphate regulon response regulator PhoB